MILIRSNRQGPDKTALNPVAQRLEASQPQRMGMDPQVQAQAMAIKQGLVASANEQLKAYYETQKAVMQAKSAEDRTTAMKAHDDVLEKNAKLIVDAKDRQTAAILERTLTQKMNQKDRDTTALKIQQLKSSDNDKRITALTNIAGEKSINERDRTILGSMNKQAMTYRDTIKDKMEAINKIDDTLAKQGTSIGGVKFPALSDADQKVLRNQRGQDIMAVKILQKDFDDVQDKIKVLHQLGIITLSKDDSSSSDPGANKEDNSDIDVKDTDVPE